MASGGIDLCMLPVPAATSVMMQNADVRDAIDLNDVWQDVGAAGTFTMGCVVARSDFVEEHPEAVDAFLTEYAASIAYVNEHPEELPPWSSSTASSPRPPSPRRPSPRPTWSA